MSKLGKRLLAAARDTKPKETKVASIANAGAMLRFRAGQRPIATQTGDHLALTLSRTLAPVLASALDDAGIVEVNNETYKVQSCAVNLGTGEHHFILQIWGTPKGRSVTLKRRAA